MERVCVVVGVVKNPPIGFCLFQQFSPKYFVRQVIFGNKQTITLSRMQFTWNYIDPVADNTVRISNELGFTYSNNEGYSLCSVDETFISLRSRITFGTKYPT